MYQEFISLGGIIDDNKSMNGIGEDYNSDVIDTILANFISLEEVDSEKFYALLKSMLISSHCFLTFFDLGQTLDEIAEIHDAINENDGVASEEDVESIFEKSNIKRMPNEFLLDALHASKDIGDLHFMLLENGFLESYKCMIVPAIAIAYQVLNGECLEEYHYDSIQKPENVEVLQKFYTREEFQALYYKMIKNYAIHDDWRLVELMWEMSEYCLYRRGLSNDDAIKETYNIHLYLLEFFCNDITDSYYYEIARSILISLLRKCRMEMVTDVRIFSTIDKLVEPDYLIKDLKADLLPKEGEIPELFQIFALYGKNDFYQSFNVPEQFRQEIHNIMTSFDEKFNEVYLKLNKKNPNPPEYETSLL